MLPVCVDMWGGFPKVIREVFPNAKIVIDRFHVQKLINQANLTSEDRSELELMLTASPSLRIAHELKEELITIYNSDITASGGMRKMKKRMQSR